eukprot:7382984-Prymnesium_polylepis.2
MKPCALALRAASSTSARLASPTLPSAMFSKTCRHERAMADQEDWTGENLRRESGEMVWMWGGPAPCRGRVAARTVPSKRSGSCPTCHRGEGCTCHHEKDARAIMRRVHVPS